MADARTPALKIGEVACKTGLPVERIRYYERRGLLEPAARSEAGYRLYTEEEVARLLFIKRAKLLGFTLEEIAELVGVAEGCNKGEFMPRLKETIDEKLTETELKLAELSAFRDGLLYYRERAASLNDRAPSDWYPEDASFCGCLEAITGESNEDGE